MTKLKMIKINKDSMINKKKYLRSQRLKKQFYQTLSYKLLICSAEIFLMVK